MQREYGEEEVLDTGQAMDAFFHQLTKKKAQGTNEFNNELQRQWTLLAPRWVQLPDVAAALFYLQKLQYNSERTAGILATRSNQRSLEALQRAALVHRAKVEADINKPNGTNRLYNRRGRGHRHRAVRGW